ETILGDNQTELRMATTNNNAGPLIRPEAPNDTASIVEVTQAAFMKAEHSSGTEAAIIEALRQAGALTQSLVAEDDGSLALLRTKGAKGCVVLGDPHFYARFGFTPDPRLHYEGAPPEYFMVTAFELPMPEGSVSYHQAFDAS